MSHPDDPAEPWTDERGWDHRMCGVNGVDLHYVTAGPEDADPVVLLHGFPECWWAWRRHVDPLSADFRVVVPDMRGYNRSGKPTGVEQYRLEPLADDLAALVEAEGYDSAHVVGHDWGGIVALVAALRRPERLDRLVVLNAPYPGCLEDQLTLRQAFRSWYVGFFQLPAVPERVLSARDFAPLVRLFREAPAVPGAYTDEDVRRYRRAWRRERAMRSMIDHYRAFVREHVRELWRGRWGDGRRVDAATLVLWGENDRSLGVHVPEVVRREVPDATVEYYPEATHWLHAEFPGRTAADVTAFLSRRRRPPAARGRSRTPGGGRGRCRAARGAPRGRA